MTHAVENSTPALAGALRAESDLLLLYDLDCGFCRFCIGVVLAWDRAKLLHPAPIQSLAGDWALAGVEQGKRIASWHLADGTGTVYSGGAAFPPLLRLLPHGRPLASLAARLSGPIDRLYGLVAANRTVVSRLVPARAKRWGDRQIACRVEGAPAEQELAR